MYNGRPVGRLWAGNGKCRMTTKSDSIRYLRRRPLAGAWGALSVLILAPPFLASLASFCRSPASIFLLRYLPSGAGTRIYDFRTPFAVCHRCFRHLLGILPGRIFRNTLGFRSPATRRTWILAALFPLAFDALAPYCGIWANTVWTRFSTGLLFGMCAPLLCSGKALAEFIAEAPWRTLVAARIRVYREAFHE